MELKFEFKSVNQDDSHSWVRISCGTVKYVTDSIEDNTENLADPQEEQIPQTSTSVVAPRSKAKAKPQPRELAGTTATIPIHQRRWIDIEPSKQDLDSYDLSKKVINLLRHNQTLHREEDGAIEFCKIKFHLRNHHSQIQNWSDDRWKACLAAGGGSKRRYQYCSDNVGSIIYLRALQGHSGSNLIDPTLQDNVLIGTGIFLYIYHVGCTFNLYSIINNGLVPGGQNLSRRQTVFYLPIDPRPTQFPKPIEDRTGKPVTQEIVGKSQGELSSSNRTGEPVKDEEKRVMKDHDRTGKPVEGSSHKVQEVGSLEHRDDVNKFNLAIDDENIDFNISGVPNAMVKRSHGINVHNLIQQIENHSQREALQSDLQQHCAFNPFSKESKDAIMAAGNTELCEIVDVEPKSQCRACLTHWSAGIVYCTCGHLMKDDTTENKKYISSVLDLFSIPNFYIRKGRPHGHRYGKALGCKEYHTANQLQKRCRKKKYDNIHDRFIRDKFFRKTMIELGRSEEIILEMDRLASEDHSHIATQEEINVYRGNWWIRSNVVNFDTMPTRRQPDFKKALSTLYRLKKAEDKKHYENWSQSSSSWWQWQTNWWEP